MRDGEPMREPPMWTLSTRISSVTAYTAQRQGWKSAKHVKSEEGSRLGTRLTHDQLEGVDVGESIGLGSTDEDEGAAGAEEAEIVTERHLGIV
jgi:hypothetical protein